MNKSYRTIWNEALGAWVAASEITALRGKSGASKQDVCERQLAACQSTLARMGKAFASATAFAFFGVTAVAQAQPTINGNDAQFSIGNASALHTTCVAIGAVPNLPGVSPQTICSDYDALAVGNGAQATGMRSIAMGTGAVAPTTNGIAIGTLANTTGAENGIAIGLESVASGATGATAVGQHAQANEVASSAFGVGAVANGVSSVAIGGSASTAVGAAGSVALGQLSSAGATHATAVGAQAQASADGSTALGHNAVADQANSVALGTGSATAAPVGTASVIIGGTTYNFAGTNPGSSVSVGSAGNERQITNVAAGQLNAGSTDAVNGSQLYATNQALDKLDKGSVKYDTHVDGTVNYNSVTLGGAVSIDGGVTGGTTITNVHRGAVNKTSTDVVNGSQLFDIAGDTSNTYLTNNGRGVRYVRTNDAGLPEDDAHAQGQGASALGYNATASGKNAVAMGRDSTASADGSVAIGAGSVANGSTLGNAAYIPVGSTYAVAGLAPAGEVSFGSKGNERRLTNVAAGADDTDAANVSQVRAVSSRVTNIIDTITNGALGMFQVSQDYNAPSPLPTGLRSVAGGANASASGNNSMALGNDSSASGNNSTALGNGSSATHDNSVALGTGSKTTVGAQSQYTGAYMAPGSSNSAGEVSVGSAGAERKVTNVADGSAATDATNVRQLQAGVEYAIDKSKNYTDNSIKNITDGGAGMFQVSQDYNAPAPKPTGIKSVAGGANSVASGNNSAALGNDAMASGTNSTAVGNGSVAKAADSVALGAGSVADRANSVSVGKIGSERQITNVAAGTANTDAVNVSQLKKSEGGNVRYETNVDGTTNYSHVALGNNQAPNGTTISNVAPGVQGTDAVNVNQLNGAVNRLGGRIDDVEGKLNRNTKMLSGGIAASAAMAVVTPVEPGKFHVSGAVAGYNGQAGIGFNLLKRSDNGQTTLHAGLGWGSGGSKAIVRVGFGFSF
jgi:autotransporter adhesin